MTPLELSGTTFENKQWSTRRLMCPLEDTQTLYRKGFFKIVDSKMCCNWHSCGFFRHLFELENPKKSWPPAISGISPCSCFESTPVPAV